MKKNRIVAGMAFAAAVAVVLTGCSSSSNAGGSATSSVTKAQAEKATSVSAFGGMKGLVAAANAEGQLNVITLPPSWANYGKIIALLREEVPEDQDQLGQPERLERRRGLRSQGAEGPVAPPPTSSTSAPPCSTRTSTWSRRTRSRTGPTSPPTSRTPAASGTTTTPASCRSATTRRRSRRRRSRSRTSSAPSTSDKVAIKGDPTQANEAASRRLPRRPAERRLGRQHPARHRLLHRS